MGAAIGLLAGAGLFCVWWSWWPPAERAPRAGGWTERTSDLLAQAGVTTVTPAALLAVSVGVRPPVVFLVLPVTVVFAFLSLRGRTFTLWWGYNPLGASLRTGYA